MGWVAEVKEWPEDEWPVQGIDARGWPCNALWCAYAWDGVTEPSMFWILTLGGIDIGDLMPSEEADWNPRANLPCLPIWTGLVADGAFYGLVWWVLLAAPGCVRRWRRRGAMLCEGCAYSLAGLPAGAPCPECGRLLGGGLRVGVRGGIHGGLSKSFRRRLGLVGH
jgi:hypothetical protein